MTTPEPSLNQQPSEEPKPVTASCPWCKEKIVVTVRQPSEEPRA